MRSRAACRGLFVLLSCVACAIAPPRAAAAKLPEWAQAIADAAPEVPAESSEHASRTLLDETRLAVEDDGSLRVRRRVANQVLSASLSRVSLGFFQFDENTKILKSRAWHRPLEGKTEKRRGSSAIDLAPGDIFLTDDRIRTIRVGDVERGSLVFFEFEAVEQPRELAWVEVFLSAVPTLQWRFELETPEGWDVRHAWLRINGPEPVVEGATRSWELDEITPIEPEPYGPSAADTAPRLVVGFDPPPGADPRSPQLRDWRAFADWYEKLLAGRDAATPPVREVARELAAGAPDDELARIRAAARYVRDRVRYVARDIGIGRLQPRRADEVLRRLYGDCKDKGTLFRSILAAEGRRSYPILVNASLQDTISERVPSLAAFDHFIVGVPLAQDLAIPDSIAPATIETEPLGRMLLVDTTDQYGFIGTLPAELAGKTALLVAGENSSLVALPPADPAVHRVERRLEADVEADGSLDLFLHTTLHGAYAARARAAHASSAAAYRDAVERALQEHWPTARLERLEVAAETDQGDFVEKSWLRAPPAGDAGGTRLLELFPGALDEVPRASLRRRRTAFHYAVPLTVRCETEVRGVASGRLPPGSYERSGAGWRVSESHVQEGTTVRGSFDLELSRLDFEPEEFGELREFWSAMRRASRAAVSPAP